MQPLINEILAEGLGAIGRLDAPLAPGQRSTLAAEWTALIARVCAIPDPPRDPLLLREAADACATLSTYAATLIPAEGRWVAEELEEIAVRVSTLGFVLAAEEDGGAELRYAAGDVLDAVWPWGAEILGRCGSEDMATAGLVVETGLSLLWLELDRGTPTERERPRMRRALIHLRALAAAFPLPTTEALTRGLARAAEMLGRAPGPRRA